MGVGTIKWQTKAACGCSVTGQSPWAQASTAQPIQLYACHSVTQAPPYAC